MAGAIALAGTLPAQAFEYVCQTEAFAILGSDPVSGELRLVRATRDPTELAVSGRYRVSAGGVRELESQLLLADWQCAAADQAVLCETDSAPLGGYFRIDANGFFRAHNPTESLLQIAVGECVLEE